MKIVKELLYPAPFYKLLSYISERNINGPILDCGSGRPNSKQALLAHIGFDTTGIELYEDRLNMAQEYAKQHKMDLPMQLGDIRDLPFESNYFGCVYSWNTIFHMNKVDIKTALNEMIRVLKYGGLCFVNLFSIDSEFYGEGEEQNPGECIQFEGDEKIMHTFLTDEESDGLFQDLDVDILFKEKRISHKKVEDRVIKDSYIDYIVQKLKI